MVTVSRREFSKAQLADLDEAALLAEELVSNHYKMSSSQWLRNRYDVRTQKDLTPEEMVEGPYAQVVAYEVRPRKASLGSSSFDYYRICLQDEAILSAVERKAGLLLFPFLIYILVHELVHIVRFGSFQQIYLASSTPEAAMEEEKKVHDLTWKILKHTSIKGMEEVREHTVHWRSENGFDTLP